MARKWSNLNIPGALHYVTGNCINRSPVFTEAACCQVFLEQLKKLKSEWPAKLIVYVLMPDHFHFISNPEDARIIEFCGELKSKAAKAIIDVSRRFQFPINEDGRQVWQESFKAVPLWSGWMIKQKINYIHANPVKGKLVQSARDYYWSSFRSFYGLEDEPLEVDHDWWWPDDAEKLSKAMKKMGRHSWWERDEDDG
ncbi:MAG TPA: transposase [Pyrinomonadaceae bacterium]|nr:transposase [Pyrinomonadaceae bacterium]